MKESLPPVTIVILTWNGLAYTRRCLETLRANTSHDNYHILVVDNGSTDGTQEFLKEEQGIQSILGSENLGFSRANNIGIHQIPAHHDVVLLNNDTEIRQSDWLEQMQQTAYSHTTVGVVGSRLVRPDGMLQHAGAYMPVDTFWGQQIGSGEQDVNQFSDDRDVESVVFACVYLKRAVLDQVGLLDEDYFCYYEDTDYCARASAMGFKIRCCGSATVVHHENVSTKVNDEPLQGLFQKGQQVFRRKWEQGLKQTRYTTRLGWHSVLNFPTGYAISSGALATGLDKLGVEVSYKYLYGPGTAHPRPEPEDAETPIIHAIRQRKLTAAPPQVVYGQGDMFHANFGSHRIGYTMLETDRIPEDWAQQANQMDEVWAPSTFNVETFRASGVVKPIHVIPLGVDPDHFNPKILKQPLSGVYTFLSIFEWGERKAPEILLRAFNEEFRADEPVILLAKTMNVDPAVDVEGSIANLGLDPHGGRIHFSLNQVVPTNQLGVLYRSADCFVLTTRGEGWGMPVIEAMACGLPVIATNWSAHCDFMTEDNAYPVPVHELIPAVAKCPYYKGFRWAEPSYRDLRRLMRHVYQNQEEARAKGSEASAYVLGNWTWQHAAAKIMKRLEAIQTTAPTSR